MCSRRFVERSAPIPRYFFNIVDGHDLPDNVGTELPDLTSVREQALTTAGELLRDADEHFWAGGDWRMHVVDQSGREVLTLHFSASLNHADTD